jgi:DegT/DnrJ/EryC1/StrS aminotransferase family
VVDTLRSGWLTTSPRVRQFEEAFAEAVGAGPAVGVNSGTAALHLALDTIGLKPGDEGITGRQPATFSTSKTALLLERNPSAAERGAQHYTLDPTEGFAPIARGAFPPGFHERLVFITDTWFAPPNPVNGRLTTDVISAAAATTIDSVTRLPFTTVAAAGTMGLQGLTRWVSGASDVRLRLGSLHLVTDGTANLRVWDHDFRGRAGDSLWDELINKPPAGAVGEAARLNYPEQGAECGGADVCAGGSRTPKHQPGCAPARAA